ANARPVAAEVNGEGISLAEVESELRLAYGTRKFTDDERERLLRAALEQVIDRRLVLVFLINSNEAVREPDVDLELGQIVKELQLQGLTLAQHAEKVGLTVEDVRRSLLWKLSWQRYCEKHQTPQNLEKFFDRSRRDFDGTQLRVAQILFKLPADA